MKPAPPVTNICMFLSFNMFGMFGMFGDVRGGLHAIAYGHMRLRLAVCVRGSLCAFSPLLCARSRLCAFAAG